MSDFLLVATVFLFTMIIAVPLSTRMGLGSVLGYLMAGIVIGPVLGVAGREMNDLQHFAEFGVVMMLFIIGLELEPRALWGMRKRLIGLGGVQILGTTGLIFSLVMAAGQEWQVALALGMILSVSSTAIVLQTLSEKNLMRFRGGRDAFAVLLTQDIAVIPMLALMPLLARSPGQAAAGEDSVGDAFMSQLPGWAAALVIVAAIATVILIGMYAIRPLFRFVHSARLREMNTIMALFIVVGIASLMSFVGLSPALGTFLAGVMLAGSEFRHELESQIEPFKGLLLGLFFITVGASMDFGLFAEMPGLVIAATLTLILAKAGVLHLIARFVGMAPRDRSLFTLSLAQAGEFGFVLISYSVALNVLPDRLAQGFLLVIAMSMLATPLLFIANDAISRRLAEASAENLDRIEPINEDRPVIIAGIGRFGQVVNRLVTYAGLKTTILDHDLKLIQTMRRFGFQGYFGDPTRPEILSAAGIDKAQIIVAAMDSPDSNVKLVKFAREKRPDIKIIARAHDRFTVYRLYAAGADHIVREMFDSSLRVGRYVLESAGFSEYEAHEAEAIFYKIDRASLRDLAQLWNPDIPTEQNEAYNARTRQINQQLEAALTERFAHGPAAGPIKPDEEIEPEDLLDN